MNEQVQEGEQATGGEENRYNESDQQKKQQQTSINRAGVEEDTSALYLTENSTLQSPQEFKADKEGDHSAEDDDITISGVANDVFTIPGVADDQSVESAEGDEETSTLNQGLEDQDIEKY